MPAVLITGASRGIGRATSLRLERAGWDVYATVRRPEDGESLMAEATARRVHPVEMDVSNEEQVTTLAERLPQRLDAVVNNAGIVVGSALEGLTPADLRRQFEVNVFGAVAVTNAVLPKLRESRGRVVFVSSINGRISLPLTGAYSASKFALEAIADAWRVELKPWGIKVVLVEPAMTDTDIWRSMPETVEAEAAALSDEHRKLYAKHLAGARKMVPRLQRLAKPADGVAATIERALTASRPRARYAVGADVRVQVALSKATPTRLMDRASRMLSGIPSKA